MLLRALAVDPALSDAFVKDLLGSPRAVRTALITFARLMSWQPAGQVWVLQMVYSPELCSTVQHTGYAGQRSIMLSSPHAPGAELPSGLVGVRAYGIIMGAGVPFGWPSLLPASGISHSQSCCHASCFTRIAVRGTLQY